MSGTEDTHSNSDNIRDVEHHQGAKKKIPYPYRREFRQKHNYSPNRNQPKRWQRGGHQPQRGGYQPQRGNPHPQYTGGNAVRIESGPPIGYLSSLQQSGPNTNILPQGPDSNTPQGMYSGTHVVTHMGPNTTLYQGQNATSLPTGTTPIDSGAVGYNMLPPLPGAPNGIDQITNLSLTTPVTFLEKQGIQLRDRDIWGYQKK